MTTPTRSTRSIQPALPVAIVTGASQGLGLALADALADRGWALVVDARRADRLDAAVARLAARTTVVGVAGDVTDPAHRAELARAAASLGTVGLLVNNASTLGASPLPDARRHRPRDVPAHLRRERGRAARAGARPRRARSTNGATVVNITSDAAVEATRAGAATARRRPRSSTPAGCSRSSDPTCACSSSIPATCAPRCTRTRSPARTSPTAPTPRRSVPALLALIEGDRPSGRYEARAWWRRDRGEP